MASMNPMQDLLTANLSAAAGVPVDPSQPDWYETYQKGKAAKRELELASKAAIAATQSPSGPYRPESDDPTDPNHPENFFSEERKAQFTVAERAARYKDWMKTQSGRFLTEEGLRSFRASATVKDNNSFGLTPQASLGENIADVGLSLGKGAIGAVKSLTDLAGPNSVSESLEAATDKLSSYMSKEAKVDARAGSIQTEKAMALLKQDVEKRMAAGDSSVGAWFSSMVNNPAEIKAFLKVAVEHPADTLAQGVGSFITLGVGKAAQLAGLGAKAVRGITVATGAAQGVGEAKGGIYEQVFKQAKDAGKSETEAKTIATDAQSYSADNLPRFLLAAGIGAIASGTGLETSLLKTGAKDAAKKAENVFVAGGKGVLKEGPLESLQEAQSTEAANNASIRASLMKESERFAGVAGKAAQAGLVGGVLGGAVDIATRNSGDTTTPPTTPPTAPGTTTSGSTTTTVTTGTAPQDTQVAAPANAQATRQTLIDEMTKAKASGDERAELAVLKRAENSGVFTDPELLRLDHGQPLSATPTVVEPPVTTNVVVEPGAPTQTTQTLYRGVPAGTDPRSTAASVGGGLFYTPDRKVAESYAGPTGTVIEETPAFTNPLEAESWMVAKQRLGLPQDTSMAGLITAAAGAGYDSLTFQTLNGVEVIALPKPAAETTPAPATMSEMIGQLADYGGIVGTLVTDGNTGGFRIIGPGVNTVVESGGPGRTPAEIGVSRPTQEASQAFMDNVNALTEAQLTEAIPPAAAAPAVAPAATPPSRVTGKQKQIQRADARATRSPAADTTSQNVDPLLRDQSRDRPGETTFALADDANGPVQTLLAGLTTSKDKQASAWATEILPLLGAVTIRRVPTDHPMLNPAGSKTYAMGAYAPSTREVLIPVGDNVSETTLIHELTHAAVDTRMHTPPTELTRQQNIARGTLEDIYNTIAQTIEISPDTFVGISRYDALNDHNGVSSVHEFIAEVRSNPVFRALLQEIPLANGQGQNSRFMMWDVFVKAIRDLLGLDTKNATVLEAADKIIPTMFLPPEARFGKALPRKADVGLWAEYGQRAEKPQTNSWARRSSEQVTEMFADHGARGKNQILDEMEAKATTPELRAALETLRQDITLRDVNGATGALAKTVLAPVEELINRLSTATGIDRNELRHQASVVAVARHSLQQSEVRQAGLEARAAESAAMLVNYDIVQDLLKEYRGEINRVTAKIDKFTDKLPRAALDDNLTYMESFTKRRELLTEMSTVIEQVSAKLDAVGFGDTSPQGKALTLMKRALVKRRDDYNQSSDLRKITEAAKMFGEDLKNMVGPRSALKHVHEGRTKLLQDWNAAQANGREVSMDGTDRMVTFGSVKMPGGLRVAESNQILADVAASRDGDVITEVSVALRDAYRTLTDEAVKAGVVTPELAAALRRDSPEYVNTMGQSDADMDTDFTESTIRGYLTPADGSAHKYNSNDTFSNLLARTQKLAVVVANQKVGKSMDAAIQAGSKLFRYERPSQRAQGTAKPGETTQTYLQYNDGKETRMMTPTTDEGNKMMGRHPNADTPAALQALAPITSVAGRAVTHLNPAFGPLNLMREIPTRMFNLVGRRSDLVTDTGKTVGLTASRGFFLGQAINPATWWEAIVFAANGDESQAIREFKETGGMQTFTERLSTERQVERRFSDAKLSKLGDGAEAILGFTKKWNNIFETVGVLASYKGLRQAGLSSKQAGFVTLDMMNFRQTGTVTGTILRPVYMFANATAQDALQLKRSFYNRGKLNYRAVAEAAIIASSAAMLFGMMRSGDDDDGLGGKNVDSLNDGVLYKNLLFKKDDGTYFKLPIGFGAFQSMYQMGVAYSRYQSGLITQEAMLDDWFSGFIKNVSITGGSEVPFKKDPVNWLLQTVTPDLLAAPLSVATNKNFAGGNITGVLRKDRFASEQGKWATPEAYKDVAKWARENTGFDPAPESVRAIMDGYMLGPLAVIQDYFVDVNADREAKGLSIDTSFSGMQRALGVNRILAKTDETRRAQHQFYLEEEKVNDLLKKYDAVIPKDLGTRESHDQKMARLTEAGMLPEEYDALVAKKTYDKAHADIKKRGDILHDEQMKGVDNSAALAAINQEEVDAMTTFVKSVRGIN